jgi:hypothetical protein
MTPLAEALARVITQPPPAVLGHKSPGAGAAVPPPPPSVPVPPNAGPPPDFSTLPPGIAASLARLAGTSSAANVAAGRDVPPAGDKKPAPSKAMNKSSKSG